MEGETPEDVDVIEPYQTDDGSDYNPEDEEESSDSVDPEPEGSVQQEHTTPLKTRKRRRRESEWQVRKKKMLRNSGKAYVGHKKKAHLGRNMKLYDHTCRYNCNKNISETDRRDLFEHFYDLSSYDLQNSFLSACIKKKPVQRKRNANSGKHFSTEISLLNKRVCKMFFLRTFDISNKRFSTVCSKTSAVGICDKDRRGQGPGRKMDQTRRKLVIEHIKMFPKYRSHYSRQSNLNTRYLSPELNITIMYNLYTELCKERNALPVKPSYYRFIFNTEFNLRFHRPNSDSCCKCDSFNNIIKHSQDEDKVKSAKLKQSIHHRKAEKATSSKKIDAKENEGSPDTCVLCFDLQQALPTPLITTSKVFYLRQLWTYNFCVHNLVTGKSDMYVWDETVSSRGSQEIGSCLIHFINKVLPQNVTKIIAYSDSCGGQNKNKNIVKLFMFLVKTTKIQEIHHKFLEPGHTFMECNRDFGIIEKAKRKIPQVFIPQHWRTVIKQSCKKFSVHEMTKEDFYSFFKLNAIIGDPKKDIDKRVLKWREIQYFLFRKSTESFCFYFKQTLDLSFPFTKCVCPSKVIGRPSITFQNTFTQLHDDSLKINVLKWKNLQLLLEYIPPLHHDFYNSMQYESKEKKNKTATTSKQGKNNAKAGENNQEEYHQEVENEEEEVVDSESIDFILYSDYE